MKLALLLLLFAAEGGVSLETVTPRDRYFVGEPLGVYVEIAYRFGAP